MGIMAVPATSSVATAARDPREGRASVADVRDGAAAAAVDRRDGRASVSGAGGTATAGDPREARSAVLGGGWGFAVGSEWHGTAGPP